MDTERLEQQLSFVLEIDKLKSVSRRTLLLNLERRENSAEHSWHLAVMALLLGEYANEPVDIGHVLRLVLVHDIVEIDAGDTYAYGPDVDGQLERERRAADRIFGLLPPAQGEMMRQLWDEFEAGETAEARFAQALDRLQPFLHNYCTEGRSWQFHKVTPEQARRRAAGMAPGSATLHAYVSALINDAVVRGYLGTAADAGRAAAKAEEADEEIPPPRLRPGGRIGVAPGAPAGSAIVTFHTHEGFMQLEVLRQSYPDAKEGADRSWLSAHASAAMPGFKVDCPIFIWQSDLSEFHRDIRSLLAGVGKRATFRPIEEGMSIVIEPRGDGQFELTGHIENDESSATVWLTLQLLQADMQAAMLQLADAMAKFPVLS